MPIARPYSVSTWKCRRKVDCTHLRIRIVGKTYDRMRILCLAGFEVFGTIRTADSLHKTVDLVGRDSEESDGGGKKVAEGGEPKGAAEVVETAEAETAEAETVEAEAEAETVEAEAETVEADEKSKTEQSLEDDFVEEGSVASENSETSKEVVKETTEDEVVVDVDSSDSDVF
jgi:hypothetical protein